MSHWHTPFDLSPHTHGSRVPLGFPCYVDKSALSFPWPLTGIHCFPRVRNLHLLGSETSLCSPWPLLVLTAPLGGHPPCARVGDFPTLALASPRTHGYLRWAYSTHSGRQLSCAPAPLYILKYGQGSISISRLILDEHKTSGKKCHGLK